MAEQYVSLRQRAGMSPRESSKAEVGLKNSLFIVTVWDEDELIGFGRVVGDNSMAYMVSDIMVAPEYRRKGIGKQIMGEIDSWLERNTDRYAYVCLIADKPADRLYTQFRFEYSEPKSCGMKRRQSNS
jgi:GNAT superfamily N-acetyltransferase